jgi:hypothetical protein
MLRSTYWQNFSSKHLTFGPGRKRQNLTTLDILSFLHSTEYMVFKVEILQGGEHNIVDM